MALSNGVGFTAVGRALFSLASVSPVTALLPGSVTVEVQLELAYYTFVQLGHRVSSHPFYNFSAFSFLFSLILSVSIISLSYSFIFPSQSNISHLYSSPNYLYLGISSFISPIFICLTLFFFGSPLHLSLPSFILLLVQLCFLLLLSFDSTLLRSFSSFLLVCLSGWGFSLTCFSSFSCF